MRIGYFKKVKSNVVWRLTGRTLILVIVILWNAQLVTVLAEERQRLTDTLQQLISGSSFEFGKKDEKYEQYKYDDYLSDGCSVQWKETHVMVESLQQVSLTTQESSVSLRDLDTLSVRLDKYRSGYVVSFTTRNLERRIKAKVKTVYADKSEDVSLSFSSGYGFYFSNEQVAKKVTQRLIAKSKSCKT